MSKLIEGKRMKDLVGKITSEGRELPFREYMEEMSGSGVLLDDYIEEIIEASLNKETSWDEVMDYLGPITTELLIELVQEDKETYYELSTSIKSAYQKIKSKEFEDKEFIFNDGDDLFVNMENLLLHLDGGSWSIKSFEREDNEIKVVVESNDRKGR